MEDKNLEDIICCSICLEIYNESDRCPRILFCGHSYCHSCLDKLLMNGQYCPVCNSSILFENTELIPINFSLKSLISTYAFEGRIPISEPHSQKEESYRTIKMEDAPHSPTPKGNLILEPKHRKFRSEGYCSKHDSFRELRCINCDLWVCAMCVILYHKQDKCKTMLVEDYYKKQKNEIFENIKKELETRYITDKKIITSLKVLNEEKVVLMEEIKIKEKELEKRIDQIGELESQKNDGYVFCKQLKHLQTLLEKSGDEIEFSKVKTDINSLLERGISINTINYTDQKMISFPMTIEKLDRICNNEAVYAMTEQAQTLYGRVRVNLGRIWIESFETDIPEGRFISYKELLLRFNRFYELPKMAFMRLSPLQGGPDLEIVVETDGKSPRAQNFVYLCSAIRRRKYKGATLIMDSFFCQLVPGPVPVVTGIKKDGQVPVKEGVVVGTVEGNSWFAIAMKDFPDKDHQNHRIGHVVTGLQVLKELSCNVRVKECGLVL